MCILGVRLFFRGSRIIWELIFSLLVTMLLSSVALANPFASETSQEGNHAYGVSDGTGHCPPGYLRYKADECRGKITIIKECPKGFTLAKSEFDPSVDVCNGDINRCDDPSYAPPGYRETVVAFGAYCRGPPIVKSICPSGYHQHPSSPELCIGPPNP